MNIAVIGSNGFIGKRLTQRIIQTTSYKVFLFGKSSNSFFKDALPYSKIDLTDQEQVTQHFSNIDLIYYLASESIPSSSWQTPLLEIELNLIPFIRFMDSISGLNVKKVAFVSSAGTVYGPSTEKMEENADKNPFSPYGITKLTMEYFLNYYRVKYGIHSDVYRVSNVYGEGQDTSKGLGIINTFLEQIIKNGSVTIFGTGENTRNYIYIGDVARILMHSIASPQGVSNTFNLSSDDTVSINRLVAIIKEVVNNDFEVKHIATRESDNTIIELDNLRIKNAIPNLKFTPIMEGITLTYNALKTSTNNK